MKKTIFILTFLNVWILSINAQSNTYDFKSKYDELVSTYSGTKSYNQPNSSWYYAWGFYLLSNIRMYEATGQENTYLQPFVNYSYEIQMKNKPNGFWWYDIPSIQVFCYTGQVLYPMAEFVRLVKNNPFLYNTNLPSKLFPNSPKDANGHPVLDGQVILGYGDYANWLQGKLIQTVDYMVSNYWLDYTNGFTSDISNLTCAHRKSAVINFQAPWAITLFNLGLVTNNYNSYKNRAIAIGNMFKSELSTYTNVASSNPQIVSYTWFHNYKPFTQNGYDPNILYREDDSHGAVDMWLPIYLYKYGGQVFTLTDLNRFAHTFTYNIWDRYSNTGFRNNVFGMNTGNHPQTSTCPENSSIVTNVNINNNYYAPGEILPWIILAEYDDYYASPNDIYTILLDHAKRLLTNSSIYRPNVCNGSNTSGLSGAQAFYGLAEIVKTQWKKNGWAPTYIRSAIISNNNETVIENSEYLIYPNPTKDFVTIEMPKSNVAKEIFLYNTNGIEISHFKEIEPTFQINLNNYEKGIYIMRIVTENESIIEKIIKE